MTTTCPRARSTRTLTPTLPRELWVAYKQRPTIRVRNLIIEAYLPLLRAIAAKIKKGLPAQVELEELVSTGCFGLIDAVNAFDPSRDVQFSTFCARRVHGSIIDGLRSMDLPPRQVREHEALVRDVCDTFAKQFGRPPCDEEVLSRLGVDEPKARRILRNSRVVRVGSLSESPSANRDRPVRPEDSIADRRRPSALSAAMLRDLKDFALRRLTRTERLVLILYYSEKMTMREIGIALGLSESRISQLRGIILAKLRDRARRADADRS